MAFSSISGYSLLRDLNRVYPKIKGGEGNFLETTNGRKVFDAATGAAVSCLGHGNKRVIKAVSEQLNTGTPYLASSFRASQVVEGLCQELIRGTDGKMARVYLTGSGSEAMEAAIKLSRQYFYEKDKETTRVNFITRDRSYHGNTLGALGVSGFLARREPYTPFLMENVHHISPCYPYRQQLEGESDFAFATRKAAELETKFQELGPDTVIAFIAEPVVGAALGCVPCVPGYLQAMRDVCHRHGALFILDEVMCGMGRTGTLHAWQAEGAVPDIQINAKGLGGGYQPIASMMISGEVVNVLKKGSGQFVHGLTYQGMPVQAAAALEVQRIIREDRLVENVSKRGAFLGETLKYYLELHPHVGDIRGRGLFWGIEFVKDKATKEPFESALGVAQRVVDLAISSPFDMTVYPGRGCVDGVRGDHIILAPSYIVTEEDIERIVETVSDVIDEVFFELNHSGLITN
ncbi:pyridoxal phosphate-dependent transferase [Diaporthe sp. PMI_573]|nr:pyridoxal phosphate-dependent transferase [Diaporthaceae sp. PMI_573]